MAKPNRSLSVGTKIWAEKITAAWQGSIDGIIETGQRLVNAKEELAAGDFARMLDNELPFGPQSARKLMAIARDGRLTDRAHVRALPAHWGTLYELTKLDDDQFNDGIRQGLIRADMERKDVPKPVKQATAPRPAPVTIEHEPAPVTDIDPETGEVFEQASADMAGDAAPLPDQHDAADDARGDGIVTDPGNGGDSQDHEQGEEISPNANDTAADQPIFGAEEITPPGAGAAPERIISAPSQATPAATDTTEAVYRAQVHLFRALFPTTDPSATLEGLIAQFKMKVGDLRTHAAVVTQPRSGITIDPSDPYLAFETLTAIGMKVADEIDRDKAARNFRAPIYPDDAERYAGHVMEWAEQVRHHHPSGNPAALEQDAAQ